MAAFYWGLGVGVVIGIGAVFLAAFIVFRNTDVAPAKVRVNYRVLALEAVGHLRVIGAAEKGPMGKYAEKYAGRVMDKIAEGENGQA